MNKQQEHPLANLLVNVLIPVMVLSFLSKDPALQQALGKPVRPWHLGPQVALGCALALSVGYGIWHFIRSRKANFFSLMGLFSVLLTGGLTCYLWNPDGSVKVGAGWLFGVKEAVIPLVLGLVVLGAERVGGTSLVRIFIYNDMLFDIPRIEARVAEIDGDVGHSRIVRGCARLFAASFFLSSLMNLLLAQWFFRGFDHTAADALERFNTIVGRLMGYGFLVIGAPMMVFLYLTLRRLIRQLGELTGLTEDELMLPR